MMRIMQIGDLHFDNSLNTTDKDKRENCFDEMFKFLESENVVHPVDYLVVGGDVAYHSAEDEYEEAKEFFNRLMEVLDLEASNIIICPGNHDLIREEMEDLDIPKSAKEIEKRYLFEKLDSLSRPFANYIKFCNELSITPAVCRRDGLVSHLLGVRSFDDIQFLILNSAWAAKSKEYDGKMFVGANFIESIIAGKILDENKITIAVMHHQDNCLIDFERGSYRGCTNTLKKIQQISNLTLCGHTHEIELSISEKYNTAISICGAAFIDNHYPNGVAFYDIGDRLIEPIGCYFNDGTWEKKKSKPINVHIPEEKGKRELELLCNLVLKQKDLSYKVFQKILSKNLLRYIKGLKNRKKGWLSSYDKALLLLCCTNDIAKESINIHYPEEDSKELKNFVDSITMIPEYRNICLAISLGQILGDNWKVFYDRILKLDPVIYNHSIWGECTNDQYRKIISQQSNTDVLQIKLMGAKYKLMENVFASIHNVISSMELCLTSPYIISHSALTSLETNYSAPVFFRGDYLKDESASYKIDQIRRSLIIYYNLERFAEIHEAHQISIIVHLFRNEYPGFGYQSIKKAGFAHIFPDCLPLSKPKFRFAVEVKSADLVNDLEETIKKRFESGEVSVETIVLNKSNILQIRSRVQKELSEYLTKEKISFEKIEQSLVCLADKVEKDINKVREFMEECYGL